MPKYYIIHKPYGVLSQFTKEVPEHRTLGDLYDFPKNVYPVGRLDKDSEGLLILTDDGRLTHQLLEPKFQHKRTYWVQVEGSPSESDVQKLSQGVKIKLKKGYYQTLPIEVQLIDKEKVIEERDPPVRFRKSIPTTWLSLTLKEGKNRQVRKMCAGVGFPVLRLIRGSIENLKLDNIVVGAVKEIPEFEIKKLLRI
ncbi:MAG: 23S rRNA pseudouridine2457 synthase [Paraglaciecola sp.]|jgi:23S rRNA pseudouridine2457 synthase